MPNQYRKITLEDCQKWAAHQNGKCLSLEYVNANKKIKWQCELGHEFDLAWKHIQYYKSWCPHCNINTGEEICRIYLESMFKQIFNKIRPDWLKYNKLNLELDGYCASLNIAFEHNGSQHDMLHSYFHKDDESLREQMKRDVFKIKKCQELGIKLIVIPELFKNIKLSDLKDFIISKCNELAISLPTGIDNLRIDISKINVVNKIQHYKNLAVSHGGKCLSNIYVNFHELLIWQCERGHIWKAPGFSIENGTWCPSCSGLKKLTIEDAVFTAAQKNGFCLSKVYISSHEKLLWKCEKGHEWLATMASVRNVGTWCPICRVKQQKITERVS